MYSPYVVRPALGLGSAANGGAASTADGGRFAMGNTEENLIVLNLGVAQRGDPSQPAFDRTTGEAYVRITVDHDYADALSRGHRVTLLVAESTGALSPSFWRALRALASQASAPTTHDSTVYGTSRSSPSSFYDHHLTALSAAIVSADAATVQHAAAAMSFKVSIGVMP